jgi:hypothetical protein
LEDHSNILVPQQVSRNTNEQSNGNGRGRIPPITTKEPATDRNSNCDQILNEIPEPSQVSGGRRVIPDRLPKAGEIPRPLPGPGGRQILPELSSNNGCREKPLTTNSGGRVKPLASKNIDNENPGLAGSTYRGGLAAVCGDLPGATGSTRRGKSAAVCEKNYAAASLSCRQSLPRSGCVPKTGRGLSACARPPRSGVCVLNTLPTDSGLGNMLICQVGGREIETALPIHTNKDNRRNRIGSRQI